MNYFYAYLPENQISKKAVFMKQSVDHVYIDSMNSNEHWNELVHSVKRNDRIIIPAIEYLSSEEITLKQRLKKLKELEVLLSTLDEKDVDADLLLALIEFVENSRKKRTKQLQMVGIEKALEKKYKGEGNFGRPKVYKPEDFGENLRKIMRKELSHDSYREQLGMKRSTYYKLVKEERDSWKQIKEEKC